MKTAVMMMEDVFCEHCGEPIAVHDYRVDVAEETDGIELEYRCRPRPEMVTIIVTRCGE